MDDGPTWSLFAGAGLLPDAVRSVLEARFGPEATPEPTLDATGADCAQEGGCEVVRVLLDPDRDDWRVIAERPGPVVLVVSVDLGPLEVAAAVLLGAEAVVSVANDPIEAVADAIACVHGGATLLTPTETRALAVAARIRAPDVKVVLTPRELDILRRIDLGESVKQTARTLSISAKTVENLQSRLFRKLGVRNRAQAVHRAHELVLLGDSPETQGQSPT